MEIIKIRQSLLSDDFNLLDNFDLDAELAKFEADFERRRSGAAQEQTDPRALARQLNPSTFTRRAARSHHDPLHVSGLTVAHDLFMPVGAARHGLQVARRWTCPTTTPSSSDASSATAVSATRPTSRSATWSNTSPNLRARRRHVQRGHRRQLRVRHRRRLRPVPLRHLRHRVPQSAARLPASTVSASCCSSSPAASSRPPAIEVGLEMNASVLLGPLVKADSSSATSSTR